MDLTRGARPEERIDWRQVRLLLATNWRVRVNQLTRKPVVAAFAVLTMGCFAFGAVALSAAIGFWVASLRAGANPSLAAAAVHFVFLSVFFLIVVTPVLGFRGNEFLDVTKLLVFPVGHRTIFASTLAGLAASGPVLFLGLPLVAVVIGYGGGIATIAAGLLAALLLLLVSVALGQFVLYVFLNVLRSRKWRDLSMVLVPVVVGSLYVGFQVMSRGAGEKQAMTEVVAWFDGVKDWTLVLPSWWAAHAATGANWTRLVLAAPLAGLVAWLVRSSATLQERAFHGEVEEGPVGDRVGARGLVGRLVARMRGPVGAVAEKELAILRREPAVRSILVGQAIYPIGLGGYGLYSVLASRDPSQLARFAPLAGLIAYPMLLMELGLSLNLLGLEGGGAVHSLLLPVPRRVLLLGKALAHLLVFGSINAGLAVLATVAAYAFTGAGGPAECAGWAFVNAVEGYCAAGVGLAIGFVVSVMWPVRIAVRDRRAIRQQATGREGCLRSVLGLSSVFAAFALSFPFMLLFHAPYVVSLAYGAPMSPWTLVATVPVAAALAGLLVRIGAGIGGRLLAAREEDVAARLGRADD